MEKKFYLNKIRELDPDSEIVEVLDLDNESIKYHSEIETDRRPKYETEEFCRAYLVAWLCSEAGYSRKNIYLEKKYTIGRPGGTSAFGDILVRRFNDETTPYMLIEVKTPTDYDEGNNKTIKGQLFDVAKQEVGVSVLSLATVKKVDDNLEIQCMTIDYSRHPDFDSWIESKKPSSHDLPTHFGKVVSEPLIKDGKRDLRDNITLDEFDIIWDKLHNLLWGGHLDDNVVFKWVVYLLLAKIYDEKNTIPGEEYEFQLKYIEGEIEDKYSLYNRINNCYKNSIVRYLKPDKNVEEIGDLGGDDFAEGRVRYVVEQLQEISITKSSKNHSGDLLGRFFDRIIKEGFKQSKATFLTHPNIVYFMLEAVGLKSLTKQKLQSRVNMDERMPYIIDPSCGSGTFLLGAFRMIEDYVKENKEDIILNDDIREIIDGLFGAGTSWAHTHIYGLDPHISLPIAAKVNMILHGDGSGHIFQESALAPLSRYSEIDDQRRLEPVEEKSDLEYKKTVSEGFDLIITNPPFSITLSEEDKRSLNSSFEFAENSTSENLFIERWYQLLKPKGRLTAVLPESFFNVGENNYIRYFMFKYFNIKAIVSLPEVTFEPHTTTLTSLLFAQKKTKEKLNEWKNVWNAKEIELENEVDSLRKELYKNNWPSSTEEQQEWIINMINKVKPYLEKNEVIELKKLEDIEDIVYKLRYKLGRAKEQDKVDFLIEKVCEELDYEFPVVTVENVGYKRTKRSTRVKDNDLFRAKDLEGNTLKNIESIEAAFTILYNVEDPETALDVIEGEVEWE